MASSSNTTCVSCTSLDQVTIANNLSISVKLNRRENYVIVDDAYDGQVAKNKLSRE